MAGGWNLWVWLVGVVVRRYIDILTIIIINFPYAPCISSFFCCSIPTSLFIFKMFFRSLVYRPLLKVRGLSIEPCFSLMCIDLSIYVHVVKD